MAQIVWSPGLPDTKTMKIPQMIILALVLTPVIVFILAQLGLFSGQAPSDLGISNEKLKAPSRTENSVSSQARFFENTDANVGYAKMPAYDYRGDAKSALSELKKVISADFPEAQLVTESENYLRYEFKTKLMKFTDDVEFLLVDSEKSIHFRSASRLGRRDLGKNRARMESIREKFSKAIK